MSGIDRLISVDSHYRVAHEDLLERIPQQFHDEYHRAVRESGAAQAAAMQQRGSASLDLGSYR
jgi:hypothetical protein